MISNKKIGDENRMEMSNVEICSRYRKAANKISQIEILASLNGCDCQKIEEILKENGALAEETEIKRLSPSESPLQPLWDKYDEDFRDRLRKHQATPVICNWFEKEIKTDSSILHVPARSTVARHLSILRRTLWDDADSSANDFTGTPTIVASEERFNYNLLEPEIDEMLRAGKGTHDIYSRFKQREIYALPPESDFKIWCFNRKRSIQNGTDSEDFDYGVIDKIISSLLNANYSAREIYEYCDKYRNEKIPSIRRFINRCSKIRGFIVTDKSRHYVYKKGVNNVDFAAMDAVVASTVGSACCD